MRRGRNINEEGVNFNEMECFILIYLTVNNDVLSVNED